MDLPKIIDGWKHLGFWDQSALVIGIIGTVASILSLGDMQLPINDLITLTFFIGFWLLVYGNIQLSRKFTNAENDLDKVDGRINQAVAAVYAQKREEVTKLEMDIAAWKDKAASWQDKADLWKKGRDGLEVKVLELQNMLQRERNDANERVEKTKNEIDNEWRQKFREYIEFQIGMRHYVGNSVKLPYNQESDQYLIEQLPSQDLRDKAGEIMRKRSK